MDYVERVSGSLPIVISVPHGGYLVPDDIPERSGLNCCVEPDHSTLEVENKTHALLHITST